MSPPGADAIAWPAIAMAALTYAVWATLVTQRMRHIAATPPRSADFASSGAAGRYFEPVALPADNLANLFEMPVLFYALVALLLATGLGGAAQIALAWGYVALRSAHSIVHVVVRKIRPRFRLYLVSCMVLSAMWIGFAIDLARR